MLYIYKCFSRPVTALGYLKEKHAHWSANGSRQAHSLMLII